MKRKKLPAFVSNPLLVEFFQSKAGRVLSNWVLQGMLYMNPVEVAYKIGLDVVLSFVWLQLFPGAGLAEVVAAWLLAHTTNWIINCQPIALLRHMDYGKNDARHFMDYIEGLEKRIQGRPYIAAAASYGSLSRCNYKDTSDIDIRFIMKEGALRKLQIAHYCFIERLRAAIHRFPLDLYAFTLEETRQKMNADEVPVVFSDPEGIIKANYGETVAFPEFRKCFRKKILGEALP